MCGFAGCVQGERPASYVHECGCVSAPALEAAGLPWEAALFRISAFVRRLMCQTSADWLNLMADSAQHHTHVGCVGCVGTVLMCCVCLRCVVLRLTVVLLAR